MKNLFLILTLFLGTALCLADTVPFALDDVDGNTTYGCLLELTPETIVLQTENGERKEFAIKQVVRIKNLLRNPFILTDVTPERSPLKVTLDQWGRPIRNQAPMMLPRPSNPRGTIRPGTMEVETKTDGEKGELPSEFVVIDLTDGSRLLATELTTKGKTTTLQLFPQGELKLPLDHLVAVRLTVADIAQVFDSPADWVKLLEKNSTKGDRLVVGTVGSLDAHEGILNEITDETIRFSVDGETLPVPRRKVFGLIFHQQERPKTERPFARLVCWNGTFLALNSLKFAVPNGAFPEGEETVAWTTLGGAEGRCRLEDVDEIVFETMGTVFLSELTPNHIEQTLPFVWEKQNVVNSSPLALFQRFQANRLQKDNKSPIDPVLERIVPRRLPGDSRSTKTIEWPIPDFQGIELDGTVYRQGFVIPAKTTLVFPLKEPYKTFTAKIGIDDRIRPDGLVRLTILGDEFLLLDTVVYGDEPTGDIRLNIEQYRKLTISVDFVNGDPKAAVLSLAELKLVGE